MKKFIAILLAVLFFVFSMPVFASAANEDIIASIKGGSAQIGGTITVPISLDVNKGFVTLGIKVSYDADVLEIVCPNHEDGQNCSPSVEKIKFQSGNQAFNSQYHTKNPYHMQWAYGTITEDISTTGKIASITFKIKETAKIGETKVSVDIDQASCYSKKPLTFAGGEATIAIGCANHIGDGNIITQNPTCTEKGVKSFLCSTCGIVARTEELNPTGHTLGEWTKTKEPTLTSEGERTAKCSVCGDVLTETIPKLTTTLEGDKIDIVTDNKQQEKPADGFKVDSTNEETFSGYVKAEIKETFPKENKPIVIGDKTVAAIYNIVLRDTENNKTISNDKIVVITIPVRDSIIAAYENIVLVKEDSKGNYTIINDVKLSNGKFIISGKYGEISKLLIAGNKIAEDATVSQETQSDVSGEMASDSVQSSAQKTENTSSKRINPTLLTVIIVVVLATALAVVYISMKNRF